MKDETQEQEAAAIASQQMWKLVHSFPSLREYAEAKLPENYRGLEMTHGQFINLTDQLPAFDQAEMESSLAEPNMQRLYAMQFLRAIAAPGRARFHFILAFVAWDSEHRQAFFRWCHSPFFPGGPPRVNGPSTGA